MRATRIVWKNPRTLRWKTAAGAVFSLCLTAPPADAVGVDIRYTLTPLAGDVYRYEYTVFNDGSLPGSMAILGFQIDFPNASNLTVVSDPALAADWDQQILAPAFQDPAAFDALALSGGIPAVSALSGFAVQFFWSGGGTAPGSQAFEIYDPNTFGTYQAGFTKPVPEPATLALFWPALAYLWGWLRFGPRSRLLPSRCEE